MKRIGWIVGVAMVLAAMPTAAQIKGIYIESRTADVYTGPCFANGEVNSRLRGDELDEMEPRIWDSAAGAPGRARIKGIISQVVGCSTLQHAAGTMKTEEH